MNRDEIHQMDKPRQSWPDIDLADVPNHIARVSEYRRAFPNNTTVINGLKLVEAWTRGAADLTDGKRL
jgi:hypothetical protein